MPWNEVTKMSLKLEFVRFALKCEEPFSQLCQRFKISRKTGYKLMQRYAEEGENGLLDHSRRPNSSPAKTTNKTEKKIIDLRLSKPSWGSRKIHAYLQNKGEKNLPALSTITEILRRNKLIVKRDIPKQAFERFEHARPNDLWQVDFKGHFAMRTGRCHPLTILDDHSRYSIGLKACSGENTKTVKKHFIDIFEEYGLPFRMNFDNGVPWASSTSKHFRYTELTFWLIRLGIQVSFSQIRRPQTNGKLERFHRTLKSEVLQYEFFWNLKSAQMRFDKWRFEYNHERPHEALDLKSPVSRYQFSHRQYSENLPEIDYRDTDIVRNVDAGGKISYQNRKIFISEGLKHLPVALREREGIMCVYFCHQKLLSLTPEEY